MCACCCGIYTYVGAVSQGFSVALAVLACAGMVIMVWAVLDNPMFWGWMFQWVLVNGMGLSSLVGVLLGCTTLMRANSPKHPREGW